MKNALFATAGLILLSASAWYLWAEHSANSEARRRLAITLQGADDLIRKLKFNAGQAAAYRPWAP